MFEIICMYGELQTFKVEWLKNHVTVKPLQMNVLFLNTLPITYDVQNEA